MALETEPRESSAADKPVRVVLVIAGSDSSGGAGIQADIKAAAAFGVHAATAITAVTAQNSEAVEGVFALEAEQVRAQIRAITTSMRIDAVKLGMLANAGIIQVVAEELARLDTSHVVMDPVLFATSGGSLFSGDARELLLQQLLPRVGLLTPNLPEAAALLGGEIAADYAAAERQAQELLALGPQAVLVKGGHLSGDKAVDYLASAEGSQSFASPRVHSRHTHGSGCTLSTAVAAGLAQGLSLRQAVAAAKTHIQGAITHAERLGLVTDNGPVHQLHQFW